MPLELCDLDCSDWGGWPNCRWPAVIVGLQITVLSEKQIAELLSNWKFNRSVLR